MKLGDIIQAIDTEVRTATVQAHQHLLQVIEGAPLKVADTELSAASLMPREVQHAKRITLDLTVYLKDGAASLERHLWGGGSPAKLRLEWEATECPEALSRVRVKEENSG